jgi:hypothetical protein
VLTSNFLFYVKVSIGLDPVLCKCLMDYTNPIRHMYICSRTYVGPGSWPDRTYVFIIISVTYTYRIPCLSIWGIWKCRKVLSCCRSFHRTFHWFQSGSLNINNPWTNRWIKLSKILTQLKEKELCFIFCKVVFLLSTIELYWIKVICWMCKKFAWNV